ncbi:YqzH family protein [Bacillus sp. FJAT-45037]|uniref:YqzH family protein n=1 Tax=Bacillus sp. FJAT-45037 TaxID=2011007 RepID=UPI0012FDCBF4|nr:YqzH family protein [Bacillus sp. FJAT-45037]
MDLRFIQKMLVQVGETYTNGEPLSLSQKELEELSIKIKERLDTSTDETAIIVVHDVMYSFFTGQSDD